MAKTGAYRVLCTPKPFLWRFALLLRLIREEFEAQRGYVTCPRSQIQWWVCWNFSLGSVRHESHSPPCPIASLVRLTSGDMDLGNKELGVAFLQPGTGNQWWERFPGPLLLKSEVGLHVLWASCIQIKPNNMIQCDHAKINEYDVFYKYRGRLGLSDQRECMSRPCTSCKTGTVLPVTQ